AHASRPYPLVATEGKRRIRPPIGRRLDASSSSQSAPSPPPATTEQGREDGGTTDQLEDVGRGHDPAELSLTTIDLDEPHGTSAQYPSPAAALLGGTVGVREAEPSGSRNDRHWYDRAIAAVNRLAVAKTRSQRMCRGLRYAEQLLPGGKL